jgi:two-component system, chemotaxis family, chemotaxis protein CheY
MALKRTYNLEQVRFLIIEDNVNMIALVRSILQALGAKRVYEAADAKTGLELVPVVQPDIIICDWQMEPMSGLELVCRIRDEQSPSPFVPIIMLTAHSEIERVKEARDCGVNEFLVKPISARTLYGRISTIIDHPRPFVRTETYFGPDRRRRQLEFNGPERRSAQPAPVESPAGEGKPPVAAQAAH